MKAMIRSELIESVLAEMDRVWGPEGFGGEFEAYAWLKEHFGISEDEDVKWQNVLSDWAGSLDGDLEDLDETEKERVIAFLQDDSAVTTFLEALLQRYKSSAVIYPG
ncbi:hypothetical protein PSH97_21805 [Pseudomonas cucumis]|uniref:CdiI immunity protein domain-containing protein n=1 Tax=Pseudomonas cucumis TaxID=2954082 RepID=A0ABY9ETW6_9PSED|nr:hypothetical protein [Pseudomonas cucumis]WLG83710.1 hypothetical protein PSH97_21805 [Pseudomonas cucumis]